MTPRIFLLAMAAAALTASSATAQSVEGGATVQASFRGSVTAGCRVSTPTAPVADNASVSALSPGAADIAINRLVDEDGAVLGSTVILTLPAICNQAHTLNLSSLNGGLQGDGPTPIGGPFRSNVPYLVTVDWAGGTRSFATAESALTIGIGDAASGPVTVTIQIPPGDAPLAAGAYTDELVIEFGVAG